MRVIQPAVYVEKVDHLAILQKIERAGRVCYKSEDKITEDTHKNFIKMVIKNGHHSVLEHHVVTARFVVDRGVSHEIVRHRIAAYSQESTRYCNYSNDKFGKEITVIDPLFWDRGSINYANWKLGCTQAEDIYFALLREGALAQEARSVLPNSLKTEIVVTYNLREWRHFFSLRAAAPAHPQMRQVAIPLFLYMKEKFSPIFDDIGYDEKFYYENERQLAQIIEE